MKRYVLELCRDLQRRKPGKKDYLEIMLFRYSVGQLSELETIKSMVGYFECEDLKEYDEKTKRILRQGAAVFPARDCL